MSCGYLDPVNQIRITGVVGKGKLSVKVYEPPEHENIRGHKIVWRRRWNVLANGRTYVCYDFFEEGHPERQTEVVNGKYPGRADPVDVIVVPIGKRPKGRKHCALRIELL